MSRNVDLTEKLGLEGKPTITYKGTVLTVNDEAENIFRVLEMVGEGTELPAIKEAAYLIFEPESVKALKALKLSIPDYSSVVSTAIDLAMGGKGDEGNAGTPATT